jgi:hypothetical protein
VPSGNDSKICYLLLVVGQNKLERSFLQFFQFGPMFERYTLAYPSGEPYNLTSMHVAGENSPK